MSGLRQIATALCFLLSFDALHAGTTPNPEQPAKVRRNGISVGKPKVFDNRTLTLMLESLSQAYQNIQSQFAEQKALAAALANVQGFRSTEVNRSASISELGTPAVTTTDSAATGNASEEGVVLPDSTSHTTTTTAAAFAPAAPGLDSTIPAFSGYTPSYGQSSSDLLSEQVNLSYQIFNLRMILERSLSDRLLDDGARMQAVLGFNVTLDPPRTAADSVAVVEVTLEAKTETGDLSLVALMPQEKTYNSATLSTRSNAFAGSAVANVVQVGYSERRRAQTFYLYRDNDTVAYERMIPEDPRKIVFGWMFRPVLGRRSVSPGLRQLFAVASLPGSDACSKVDSQKCPAVKLATHVRTYWKKYDANTLTSFDEKDANRATRFRYAITGGLLKPEIFQKPRYEDESPYGEIDVKATADYEKSLRPRIDSVEWTTVGTKQALISARGQNFFTGTQVTIGDKTYSGNGDGLVLKSNNAFDLLTTLDAMAVGPAAVSGRYGGAIPLDICYPNDCDHTRGIMIQQFELGPPRAGIQFVELLLRALGGGDLSIENLRSRQFLVAVNGTTMALPYGLSEVTQNGKRFVQVRGSIPASVSARGHAIARITWPFAGDTWTAVSNASDPTAAYEVLRVSDKKLVLLTTKPGGFSTQMRDVDQDWPDGQCWMLVAGDAPFKLATKSCTNTGDSKKQSISAGDYAIQLNLDAAPAEKVVLLDPTGESYVLPVPKSSGSGAALKPTVKQYDSVWLDLTVKGAPSVLSAEANGVTLKLQPAEPDSEGNPGTSVKVLLTRSVTSRPGTVDVSFIGKENKVIATQSITITPCENCKTNSR